MPDANIWLVAQSGVIWITAGLLTIGDKKKQTVSIANFGTQDGIVESLCGESLMVK